MERFYESGFVGENIAWGYPSPWSAQVEGWMCSSGHRANLMSPDYEELGTGVTGVYYTQDFGSRGADLSAHPIRMGAHTPFEVLTQVTFLADYYDATGAAPAGAAIAAAPCGVGNANGGGGSGGGGCVRAADAAVGSAVGPAATVATLCGARRLWGRL